MKQILGLLVFSSPARLLYSAYTRKEKRNISQSALTPLLWPAIVLLPPKLVPLEKEMTNPLQYSCLENPPDRETWWAPVHGVTKSRTRLKQLSIA